MSREKIVSLHSRYNPEGEAERYINSLSLNEKTRFYILIEPGLGYIIPPLRKKVPGARIIVLHAAERVSSFPAAETAETAKTASLTAGFPVAEWYPGTDVTIQDFLEKEIPDSEAGDMRILEWRPAHVVYGKAYLNLVEETVEFIKRADANTRTGKAFGRKWFRNFFRNINLIGNVLCPVPLSVPLLITGAGPGLEDVIPMIREEHLQGSVFILAVSSSSAALEAGGLFPDMVLSTDGGNWAAFHLYECFRGKHLSQGKAYCSLAASLTAALPSQCGTLPILPISDGSLWQKLILEELKIPFIPLPQRGTVSASALDLAFTLTNGDIIISGLDLANRDIRSHARPYSLDRFLEEEEGKLNPVYSQVFKRASLLKDGGSFGIYASWFEKQLAAYPKRLHSLGSNNPLFNSLKPFTLKNNKLSEDAGKAPRIYPRIYPKNFPKSLPGSFAWNFPVFSIDKTGNPSLRATIILEKALADPSLSSKLMQELAPLLLPESAAPSPFDLIEVIRSLVGRKQGETVG